MAAISGIAQSPGERIRLAAVEQSGARRRATVILNRRMYPAEHFATIHTGRYITCTALTFRVISGV